MSHNRWLPLHDLEEVINVFSPHHHGLDLAADVSEDEDSVLVDMQIPGVESEKINIEVENHTLRVSGSREEKKEEKRKNYYRKEIKYGSFERMISLPCLVDQDKVTAEIKDGVLKISLPKKKTKEASKIKVIKK